MWNEITCLGPAWTDLCDLSLSPAERQMAAAGMKRPATTDPDLQPPARRGPALLAKLDAVVAAAKVAVASTSADKGKGKGKHDAVLTDSDLSDYEDAFMAH